MKEINEEIKKTFTEMDMLMRVLYSQFKDITNTLSKVLEEKKSRDSNLETPSSNDDLLAKVSSVIGRLRGSEKDVETRLNHLFNTSKPPLNDEKKLLYSFRKLQEMLTKIVSGLPGLIDEKGEINEEFLTFITNFLVAAAKLEKRQEYWIAIPAGENYSYWLVSSSEKEGVEDELDELRKKVVSLEAAEKNRNEQLRKEAEKEKKTRDEIKTELESIGHSADFLGRLSDEQLTNFITRLDEMDDWLIDGTSEQQKVIREEYSRLKELSERLELEKKRRDTKQLIARVLADEFTSLEKRPIDKGELLKEEYRNYSQAIDEKNDRNKIREFKNKMLQAIARQRNQNWTLGKSLFLGKKAIESGKLDQLIEAEKYLSKYHESQLEQGEDSKDYNTLLKKWNEFHLMRFKLLQKIEEQKKGVVAKVEQSAK